ncbi:MAG: heparinase II/III family protein, partial [Chthoniobacteraceae bacterium]|nr:heparinase II/III family protein [Chthoniobacteraceae bacterium]
MKYLLLALLALFQGIALAGEPVRLPQPLPAHPRLFAKAADWERVQKQVAADPLSAGIFACLRRRADSLLEQPPLERKLVGRRMLAVSRQVLERVGTLASVARITGDDRYAKRAVQEMLSAARFSDWHPEHFLDTAEMTLAVAMGYDWLYDKLSESDRAEIAEALVQKGIDPSFGKNADWVQATNNWSQVCHAGMSAAAIALADLQPKLATRVLQRAVDNVPRCAHAYAPDGAFAEGPMYWNYGTSFHLLLIAELETFCGRSYGLETLPGFANTGLYLNEVTTPSGFFFNYSDASVSRRSPGVAMLWFARRFHHPEWIRFDLREFGAALEKPGKSPGSDRLLPFGLLWRDPALSDDPKAAMPLHWMGRGENPVAVHRSAWDDPAALYTAIKGGSPSLSHAHMDAGSFILEADGVCWAVDPGMQDYNSLESIGVNLWKSSQNGTRWTVFRLGPEAHNILRFNGAAPLIHGSGAFTDFRAEGDQPHSVLDLTSLYSDQVRAARRGVAFVPGRRVLFQDEWTAKDQPVKAAWQMMTRAEVTVRPGEIELRQEGKTLVLKILAPANARVEVQEARDLQKPYDADNPGLRR